MLVLNLPFKALMFLTLMRPSLVLFLVLWLKLVKDFLKVLLLEEILSFRMQGVEFDNGDMYVDGHKAASDVRDEFVSVTEKLMDELAQCYNVLPQLDINNTIDHRPEGDEKWFLENEKTVTQFCRKL